MSFVRKPSLIPSRGYTAFGCLDFAADVRGRTQEPVLTGFVASPEPLPLPKLEPVQCRVGLLQSPVADPFAAFAEDAGGVRFNFMVNLLDPECRSLLERSTAQGTFQMVLSSNEGDQSHGFWMHQPFLEPLKLTAGRACRPFDTWVKTCLQLAPALPKLFEGEQNGRPAPATHCAVVMLPPSRWGDVARWWPVLPRVRDTWCKSNRS